MKKKNLKVIKPIVLISLLVLSIILIWVISVVIHEYVHKFDYRNIPKSSEEFCFLNNCVKDGQKGLAYYYFVPSTKEAREEALGIQKYTETHAMIVQLVFVGIFGISIGILFVNLWEKWK